MKTTPHILFAVALVFTTVAAQPVNPPKREFRAAWVATVTNIDWPSSKSLSTSSQKSEAIAILDKHKLNNVNAILLQVRPACDAIYQGGLEPLSEYLVGSQGGNLSVYYDPLQFWIDEAHKRGMELHAWFNPYRSVFSSGSSVHSSHISKTQPAWNITYGSSPYKFLDPGLPQVMNYVTSVIMDVVRRYNIDGVHFDDYFYPYGGMTNQDSVSWGLYGSGWSNKGDWRRNNVNTLIAMVHDSIKATKPWVKFGMSPFGIWRPNNPVGITGMDAYSQIYCDPMNWLMNHKVDYLTPQTYWVIGGAQDYSKLMPWWGEQTATYGRHLYTGNAAYRLAASSSNWPASEMQNQIDLNRIDNRSQGVVFFSSKSITTNLKGVQDSLRANQFRYPAIPPAMPWLDAVPSLPPVNLAAAPGAGTVQLSWQKGSNAADGDSAKFYAVYSAVNSPTAVNTADPRAIRFISMDGTKSFADPVASVSTVQYQTVVTSFDKLWNESATDQTLYLAPAGKPFMLVSDVSVDLGDVAIGEQATDTVTIYNRAAPALAIDSVYDSSALFSGTAAAAAVADSTLLAVTFSPQSLGTAAAVISVANNSALGTVNIAVKGNSPKPTMKMVAVSIVYGNVNIGTELTKSVSITHQSLNNVRIDSVGFVPSSKGRFTSAVGSFPVTIPRGDTAALSVRFAPDTAKVFFDTLIVYGNAVNAPFKVILFGVGQGSMSVQPNGGMQPLAYGLGQNFPNPFNPVTTISFSLPQSAYTTLKVYDLLGREVETLTEGLLDAGSHRFEFNGRHLSSGVYLYRIVAGSYVDTKRMVLQK